MKHLLIYALMLATALSFGQNVHIPDPTLKNYLVSSYDADDDGEISFTEAESPILVTINGYGFTDMTGLEAFVSMRSLSVPSNGITDLTPIVNHTTLESLNVSFNGLTTIPDLSGMTSLVSLNLLSNDLTELPDLQTTSVNSLNIIHNELTEIDTTKLPPDMRYIDFSANPIGVFPDLSGFTSMTGCGFSSLGLAIDGSLLPSSLETIYMPFSNASDLQSFEHLTQLQQLRAEACQFSGTIDLSAFPNLTLLEIGRNQITEITGLENLLLLTDLELNSNQLTSLPSLDALISLESLSVSSNQLTTLPDLSMLTQLEDLFVDENQLTELPPLPLNGALYGIDCTGNMLTSLPDLSDLPQLSFLYAARNQLSDLSDLVIPETIEGLELGYNQLVMPPIFTPTQGFRHVNLDWNFLTTIEGFPQSQNTYYEIRFNLLDETSCPLLTNSSARSYEKQGHIDYSMWLEDDLSIKDMVSTISDGYGNQAYTLTCE